ncbi:MAG: J domain-containing protein [Deltaproteobacteria bacterium]|nr:MAG: J domain-containing protein [Deltaproteobacteria bacterium]
MAIVASARSVARARLVIGRRVSPKVPSNATGAAAHESSSGPRGDLIEARPAVAVSMRNRRLALEGLAKILDAGAIEELFIGPDDEAAFLYELLVDTARARRSYYYSEICRTARRRGVTPDYVVDRAVVLLGAMAERRRMDLYRILGIAPLSSGDAIRQRWLEVARTTHPDVGGDGVRFRQAKQAYEILRDPVRRAEYERFWLRALGPFERVVPADAAPLAPPLEPAAPEAPESPAPRPSAPPPSQTAAPLLWDAARLLQAREALDSRFEHDGGIGGLLFRLETALAAVERAEIDRLRAEVDRLAVTLASWRDQLAAVAELKRRLEA